MIGINRLRTILSLDSLIPASRPTASKTKDTFHAKQRVAKRLVGMEFLGFWTKAFATASSYGIGTDDSGELKPARFHQGK
jgi:hypothetical protein